MSSGKWGWPTAPARRRRSCWRSCRPRGWQPSPRRPCWSALCRRRRCRSSPLVGVTVRGDPRDRALGAELVGPIRVARLGERGQTAGGGVGDVLARVGRRAAVRGLDEDTREGRGDGHDRGPVRAEHADVDRGHADLGIGGERRTRVRVRVGERARGNVLGGALPRVEAVAVQEREEVIGNDLRGGGAGVEDLALRGELHVVHHDVAGIVCLYPGAADLGVELRVDRGRLFHVVGAVGGRLPGRGRQRRRRCQRVVSLPADQPELRDGRRVVARRGEREDRAARGVRLLREGGRAAERHGHVRDPHVVAIEDLHDQAALARGVSAARRRRDQADQVHVAARERRVDRGQDPEVGLRLRARGAAGGGRPRVGRIAGARGDRVVDALDRHGPRVGRGHQRQQVRHRQRAHPLLVLLGECGGYRARLVAAARLLRAVQAAQHGGGGDGEYERADHHLDQHRAALAAKHAHRAAEYGVSQCLEGLQASLPTQKPCDGVIGREGVRLYAPDRRWTRRGCRIGCRPHRGGG